MSTKVIEVDVNLGEWTSDELTRELVERGDMPMAEPEETEDCVLVWRESIEQVWRDMQGKDMPKSLKAILEDATGRIWMN